MSLDRILLRTFLRLLRKDNELIFKYLNFFHIPDLRITILPNGLKAFKGTSDFFIIGEIYYEKVYDKYFTLNPGGVVIDIRAHIGLYALSKAKHASKIICFEPNPKTNYSRYLRYE